MKKVILILTLILTISCGTESKVKKPSDIGNEVFNILKNLQNTSQEEFKMNFPPIDEIRGLAQDDRFDLTNSMKNQLTSIEIETYEKYIEKAYNEIKKDAINKGIILSDITYLEFIYETKDRGGLEVIDGILYFKYDGETYEIDSEYVNLKDKFVMAKIHGIDKKY